MSWYDRILSEVAQFACFGVFYAFSLSLFYMVTPVSGLGFLDSDYIVSLFYFPHAANTIGAWLFGWRIVVYLLPISLLWYLPFRPEYSALIASLAAFNSALAQWLYIRKMPARYRVGHAWRPWVRMFSAGALATVINIVTANLLFDFHGFGDRLLSSVALATGQISGLALGMIALMLAFKVARRLFPIRIDRR